MKNFFLCLLVLALSVTVFQVERDLKKLRRKSESNYQAYKTARRSLDFLYRSMADNRAGRFVPACLKNVPDAAEVGIVLGSKKINIEEVDAPYNASIIANGSNYLLFFRYDVIHDNMHGFDSHIGCAELDHDFCQVDSNFKTLDLDNPSTEDPRVLLVGEKAYVVYNALQKRKYYCRTMHVANIDLNTLSVGSVVSLDPQLQQVEKNWVPFEYVDQDLNSHLYFEYYINPHRIFDVTSMETGGLKHLTFPEAPAFQNVHWPSSWGVIRGGTPAVKVDQDSYLGFFHSSFVDEKEMTWYVMGAYLFEASPPFRVTHISHYPILFDSLYNTPPMGTADPAKRCIFPSGFLLENREGREVIQLSCGENDSSVKIITLDKEKLLHSLKKLL